MPGGISAFAPRTVGCTSIRMPCASATASGWRNSPAFVMAGPFIGNPDSTMMHPAQTQRLSQRESLPAKLTSRFTINGSDALEGRLAEACQKVFAGVQSLIPAAELQGLVLGGGYGRGQGGVLQTEHGDEPYNDMEFYVFVRGSVLLAERRHRAALQELG